MVKQVEISETDGVASLLNRLGESESIVLCRNGKPVAEVHKYIERPSCKLGVAAGMFSVPQNFDEPLSEDLLNAFEGSE